LLKRAKSIANGISRRYNLWLPHACVLHNEDPAIFTEIDYSVHVGRDTEEIMRDDTGGFSVNSLAKKVVGKIEGHWVDVGQANLQASPFDR